MSKMSAAYSAQVAILFGAPAMQSNLERYLQIMPRNPGGGGMLVQSAVIWDTLLTAQASDGLRGDMAEIGVLRGYGAALMAAYLRADEHITLVDDRCGPEMWDALLQEMAGSDVARRAVFIRADSMALRRESSIASVAGYRFFHIDGEHSYDAVMNDLLVASSWLATHGTVVVDDFLSPRAPGITHAVFDYAGKAESGLSIFLLGFNKAYLCRNRWLGYYRQLVTTLPTQLSGHGHPCCISAGGFAMEKSYTGIFPSEPGAEYQVIGRTRQSQETFLSATNRFE